MKSSFFLLAAGLLGAAIASAQVPSTLANISSRGLVGSSSGALLGGFVVEGNASKTVLVRGIGPGLASFGVANPATSVAVRLYDANGNLVAGNDGYQNDPNASSVAATASSVGAFPLSAAGDSATVATLAPGAYSLEVAASDADAPDGAVLLEVYDADSPGSGSHIVNVSTRGQVGGTPGTLITGFVVSGDSPKSLLVRGVGSDLAAYGVSNPAAVVGLSIYDASGNVVATTGGMPSGSNAAAMTATAIGVGAFPLSGNGDSAALVTLPPGAYTVAVTSNTPDAADGTALVEVYDADSVSSPQQ